jgi:hypothetical protein
MDRYVPEGDMVISGASGNITFLWAKNLHIARGQCHFSDGHKSPEGTVHIFFIFFVIIYDHRELPHAIG